MRHEAAEPCSGLGGASCMRDPHLADPLDGGRHDQLCSFRCRIDDAGSPVGRCRLRIPMSSATMETMHSTSSRPSGCQKWSQSVTVAKRVRRTRLKNTQHGRGARRNRRPVCHDRSSGDEESEDQCCYGPNSALVIRQNGNSDGSGNGNAHQIKEIRSIEWLPGTWSYRSTHALPFSLCAFSRRRPFGSPSPPSLPLYKLPNGGHKSSATARNWAPRFVIGTLSPKDLLWNCENPS